jgi:branched-chain amino acid transport system ATP-binding protein
MANTLLKVTGLKVAYGGIQAVKGVDFEVKEGELVTLIGSNGAGKTTTMKAITGTLAAADGDIEYLGKSIKGKGSWDLVREGLAMVPEGRGVFTRMSITENLQMGAYIRNDKSEIANDIEMVFGIFPRLKERKDQLAGTMSGGEQQMLAMGRALMTNPRVLLLDEPVEGLAPIVVVEMLKAIETMRRDSGMSILMVEQKYEMALLQSERCVVIDHGSVVHEGSSAALLSDQALIDRLLGLSQ